MKFVLSIVLHLRSRLHDVRSDLRSNPNFGLEVELFCEDLSQIVPVIECWSLMHIVQVCIKSSPLCRQFRTLQITENMRLQALRNDQNAHADALLFPNFVLALGEGVVSSDYEARVKLLLSVALKSDDHRFCRANFKDRYTNCMLDD